MTQDPALRAGDADRDRVADSLREHFAAGRLTQDELQERLDATYAARTFGDLDPVLADLPALRSSRSAPASPAPASRPQRVERVPGRRQGVDKALRANWAAWVTAVSVNIVIWLLVSITGGELAYFWPMWVAGPWGAVLAAATIARRLNRD